MYGFVVLNSFILVFFLENPRDGGAWWAAVCGVAQSRARLKRLSSSNLAAAAAVFFLIMFFKNVSK